MSPLQEANVSPEGEWVRSLQAESVTYDGYYKAGLASLAHTLWLSFSPCGIPPLPSPCDMLLAYVAIGDGTQPEVPTKGSGDQLCCGVSCL